MKLKLKTDEKINPVKGIEPWDQSDRHKQIVAEQVEMRFSDEVSFELRVKQWMRDGGK